MKNDGLHIARFEQDECDIPPILKADIMHPDIYYYYKYLNFLMQQKGLLDTDGAVVYPGIGADISTINTLLGKREIIGFDAAGISTKSKDYRDLSRQIDRYDTDSLNRELEKLKNPQIDYGIENFFEEKYEADWKRKYGGYNTTSFAENRNGYNLLGELFGIGILPEDINCEKGNDSGIRFIKFTFNNSIYPPITIYQTDVLDIEYEDFFEEIISDKRATLYLEKSGQAISGANNIDYINESYPLQIMQDKRETKAICIGSGGIYTTTDKLHGFWKKMKDHNKLGRILKIKDELMDALTKDMSNTSKTKYQGYRREIDIFEPFKMKQK